MIKVYDATETAFNHNGIKILKPFLAQVYKEDNGDYYLELEASIDDIEWLEQNNIVRVNTPWGDQGFRLGNPTIKNKVITIRAKHLYFDSANYLIEDAYPQNLTGGAVLNWVLARTDQTNPFTATSDIADIHTARYVRKSLGETIASITETWGGHLERDNFKIALKQNIGLDRGVTIAYAKNLTEFKAVENWDKVVTKLLPEGYDGVMLPEKYLIADVQYDIPYTKTVTFDPSEGIDTEDATAVITDLRVQAQAYLNENKYPKVNYTVNAHIENIVDIGDTIQVIHTKSNTNLLTNVISVKYDCIMNKFKSIEFGNFRNNLKSVIKSLNNQIDYVKKDNEIKYSALEIALQESNNTIMNYLTIGHKYITENAIYFLDTTDPATAKNFMILSLGGIGFGTNGINNGYRTAWTLDGKFNADYITTGTLRSLNIESTNINNNNKLIIDAEGNLTSTGKLIASNAEIKGTIEATSGQIGRFALSESGLKSNAMEFLDNDVNPLIWLKSLDGSEHANYEGSLSYLINGNGTKRQSILMDSRLSYLHGIELVKEDISSNNDISGTQTENVKYTADGITKTSNNANPSFVINLLGNIVIFSLGGVLIQDVNQNSIMIDTSGINVNAHFGGNIGITSTGMFLNSPPSTGIYANGSDISGISEIPAMLYDISTMKSDIRDIKARIGMV